jgi:phage terminase small subunit
VSVMARTTDQTYAAAKAGYGSPKNRGSDLMARPAIRAAVIREAEEALSNEILPLALAKHKFLLTAAGVPAGAQLGAVKLAYDRTLGDQADAADAKEPSEMSYDELQASIAALRAEQAAREEGAIDVTPPADEGILG